MFNIISYLWQFFNSIVKIYHLCLVIFLFFLNHVILF